MLADAATSILAIVALFGGKWWGADWLDPLMGIVGAALVGIWARGLLADCARVLLDAEMDAPVVRQVRRALAAAPVDLRLEDLHVWRVAHDRHACIVALSVMPTDAAARKVADPFLTGVADMARADDMGTAQTDAGLAGGIACSLAGSGHQAQTREMPGPEDVRRWLADIPSLVHVTVELRQA